MQPRIGAVVLNFNSEDETVSCVTRLKEATRGSLGIYVVDNASPDGSGARLEARLADVPNVKVLRSPTNDGYAAGNNLGLKAAASDGCAVLVVVNPDVRVGDGALDQMAAELGAHEDVAVVGPRVVDARGVVQKYARKPLTFARYASIKRPYSFFMRKTARDYLNWDRDFDQSFTFEGMVSGCCFAIRADDFRAQSGLDENTFLFYEEDALGHQLAGRRRLTRFSSEAEVVHSGGATTSADGRAFVDFHRYRSAYYVLGRYGGASRWQRLLAAIPNIGAFASRSLRDPAYRKRLTELLREHRRLEGIFRRMRGTQ